MYVVGTAGHVDHGKSSLVEALTGIDPDRLAEEKERGLTIDLGFAWLKLPSGNEVSIVDVPGHERFINNMLAGVGAIDLALLIVAADESVMPQTREHLAILDILQIRRGLIAITKTDLVDEEMVELVKAGRTPEELSREFEPTAQTIHNWVKQTDLDGGVRSDGLTTSELREIRRENKRLRVEREVLKKPRPGSLRSPTRCPRSVRVREGQPGRVQRTDDV